MQTADSALMFHKAQCWILISSTTVLLLYISLVRLYPHRFSCHGHAENTQFILSISPSDTHMSAWITACLSDTSSRMAGIQLKRNPRLSCSIYLEMSISPCQYLVTASNFGVVLDNQSFFLPHIAHDSHIQVAPLQHEKNLAI